MQRNWYSTHRLTEYYKQNNRSIQIYTACTAVICILLVLVLRGATTNVDTYILAAIAAYRSPDLNLVFSTVTKLASVSIVLPIICALALSTYLVRSKLFTQYMLGLLISIVSAESIMFTVKYIVGRARPVNALISEAGKSFPSGHATFAVACYGFILAVLLSNPAKTKTTYAWIFALCVTILAIGFSRLYLGVHYPSDVLAGYAVGSIGVLLGMFALGRSRVVESKH